MNKQHSALRKARSVDRTNQRRSPGSLERLKINVPGGTYTVDLFSDGESQFELGDVSRQHFSYFLPLPHGQGSLRPARDARRMAVPAPIILDLMGSNASARISRSMSSSRGRSVPNIESE